MKRLVLAMTLAMMAAVWMGCPPSEPGEEVPDTAADVAAIEAVAQAFDEAVGAGDVDGIVAVHTADATRMPPEAPAHSGSDALRSEMEAALTGGAGAQRITVHETHVMGDVAVSSGSYGFTLTPEEGDPVSQNGKWMATFRREADGWKLHKTIWNTDHQWPPTVAETGD